MMLKEGWISLEREKDGSLLFHAFPLMLMDHGMDGTLVLHSLLCSSCVVVVVVGCVPLLVGVERQRS